MGLPKAVDSAVIERQANKGFNVAVAEYNGWRNDMEDAHLIYVRDDVAVFGVYDGHGGKDCSKFAARRLNEELEKDGIPQNDDAWEKLFIKIDQEFLESDMSSGTTATMCVVRKPDKAGGKHKLHVINAGDSRVVLGKADGSIVDGGGTDKGLTRDHKPEDPEETERIEKAGGRVEKTEGNVARVNGNLSVCRGFGDRDEKKTGDLVLTIAQSPAFLSSTISNVTRLTSSCSCATACQRVIFPTRRLSNLWQIA